MLQTDEVEVGVVCNCLCAVAKGCITAVYQHSTDGGFPKVVETFSFHRQQSVFSDTDSCVFALVSYSD